MAHLVNSVSDILDALQRDRGLGRPRVKADLQRAPSRGARPRGCANGEWGEAHFTQVIGGSAPGIGESWGEGYCMRHRGLYTASMGPVLCPAPFPTCPETLVDKDALLLSCTLALGPPQPHFQLRKGELRAG
jgi:hypothetical protein